MNMYFSMDETIYTITEKYPDLIPYLVKKGFTPLSNPVMRGLMGKKITAAKALQSKNFDCNTCEQEMVAVIENAAFTTGCTDSSLCAAPTTCSLQNTGKKRIRIEGVLPCPIRIPLLEQFEAFYTECMNTQSCFADYTVSYDLRSANFGLDRIIANVQTGNIENIPDIVLSAGFELFFDKKLMGAFIENNAFHCSVKDINRNFCTDAIDLRDPHNNYAVVAAVPAVMIVNTAVLNGKPAPKTWADILSDSLDYSVSLPSSDFDLFNSVVLTIYSRFGEKGIQNLARACKVYQHPSQMLKAPQAHIQEQPAVSIAPYFFTKMIQKNSPLKVVWPLDGAVTAPVFMMVKKETAEITKPFADFFLSEQTGTIFSQSGYFPSTHPAVDNHLSAGQTFLWAGWDFIYQNDIGKLLKKITAVFNQPSR